MEPIRHVGPAVGVSMLIFFSLTGCDLLVGSRRPLRQEPIFMELPNHATIVCLRLLPPAMGKVYKQVHQIAQYQ